MDSIKLSILLPTIESRKEVFALLFAHLATQAKDLPVELVVDCDNKQVSIGAKRQRLLEKARGEYIVFVDDDDWVINDYVQSILDNTGSDAIGFQIECTDHAKPDVRELASASRKYTDWGDNKDGFRYVRSIYHKTPVRRELALKAGFKDMRFAEDYDYSMRVMPLIQSEAYIPKVMYYYRFKYEEHSAKYGIQ